MRPTEAAIISPEPASASSSGSDSSGWQLRLCQVVARLVNSPTLDQLCMLCPCGQLQTNKQIHDVCILKIPANAFLLQIFLTVEIFSVSVCLQCVSVGHSVRVIVLLVAVARPTETGNPWQHGPVSVTMTVAMSPPRHLPAEAAAQALYIDPSG